MAGAFGWGTLAASSLVIGALVALRFRISLRVIGLIMAFGAGVLISAVAFDLVEEAVSKAHGHGAAIAGLFAGCAVFFGGDWLIDRFGGADRKDADGGQASGSALAIVLGTVLDGIPESMVIGLTIFQGGAVGAAYLTAVFISNLPESIASTSGLRTSGWKKLRILWMWIAIAVISGLASLAGYRLFQHSSPGSHEDDERCCTGRMQSTLQRRRSMPPREDATAIFSNVTFSVSQMNPAAHGAR
jgi:ZIP family zinc transporter